MSNSDNNLEILDVKLTSKNLAKKIFAAELPEQFIRTIPAQSLYIALKKNGLQSSADLLEIASIEQCRLMIDFDCWNKSYFHEDHFWEWLALTTEEDDLALLQKLLKCFDLKIITLLIARYISFEFFEEGTDTPPSAGYFTPDKGRTWLAINIEDSDRHFLFGRLLALIFETDADLFYKLLTLSSTQTQTVLEEEAFQDKLKRLSAEGIPENDTAAEVNSPANENSIRAALGESSSKAQSTVSRVVDIQAIEPLIFDSSVNKLIKELLADISVREDLENELTFIINSAIVMWSVEFYDYEKLILLTDKVKGCINIGLEKCREFSSADPVSAYKKIGLIKIYQLGLAQLKKIKNKVKDLKKSKSEPHSEELDLLFNLVLLPFPEMPLALKDDFVLEGEKLPVTGAPFESIEEIKKIEGIITSFS